MKRRVSGAALLALVLATITGCSVNYEGDDSVTHEFGSDYFGAGGMLNLTDTIEGDAFLAGGQVSTASEVKGDLVVAGGELSIGGAIGDDLYAGGGDVRLDAIVSGNARLAGGDVEVGPATVVAGALTLTGGRVQFDGPAHEYLQASGGSVRIHGQVKDREPAVDAAHGVGTVLWFAGVFCAAALFVVLLPAWSGEAAAMVGRRPLQSLGLGLAILVCVPFVAVVLLITIIGIPLALLLMALYLVVLFLGWVTTALWVAQRGLETLRPGRPAGRGLQLLALLLGLLALSLLRAIPLLGGLIGLLALLAGIGALALRGFGGRGAATA